MANIRLYQNKNKKSKAYGKYYGRVKATKTLNTTQLANHIAEHGSIITEDVLLSTINKMTKCIKELLKDGKNVKLDGLGTFYLSANTEGVANEKDFTANNVKAIRVKFIGDQGKESEYATKMLTSKAKFRSVTGEAMPGAEEGEGENNG